MTMGTQMESYDGRAVAPRPPNAVGNGGRGATALPGACKADDAAGVNGGRGATALPVRKRLNHRGPLSIDVSSAWYFITICAEGHNPWVIDPSKSAFAGRAAASLPGHPLRGQPPAGKYPRPPLEIVAPLLLREARENQLRALWRLALFLVMPDHLHLIVHVPNGGRGATALPRVIENFKHLLSSRYGLRFQRDFFDTRLRDDAHFAEEYNYILGNPVRKNLCAEPSEWPHSIAFSRETGEEKAKQFMRQAYDEN